VGGARGGERDRSVVKWPVLPVFIASRVTRSAAPEAAGIPLMLAERRAKPFDDPAWLFELKYDGFRVLAAVTGGRPRVFYRGGSDATATFPEVAEALARLRCADAVIDGELVVVDPRGRPQFQRLQQRFQLRRTPDRTRAAALHPACLFAFDLLRLDGEDLRLRPLVERKEMLRRLVPRRGRLRYVQHVRGQGVALFEEVRRRGLEGVLAKRADSPYQGGRSSHWLKVTAERTGDFAVVGLTKVSGAEEGALHLAVADGGRLGYVGSVGTGFKAGTLAEARRILAPYAVDEPPCVGALPSPRAVMWVPPMLVCEVRYKAWTAEGLLRLPVFKRFRPEARVEDCVREGLARARPAAGRLS
jgi:bifunctional non-homologous end joining protein LigD